MHTNSVKEQHWLQVGGFMMYSLNVMMTVFPNSMNSVDDDF
jgi:hypothetical protein